MQTTSAGFWLGLRSMLGTTNICCGPLVTVAVNTVKCGCTLCATGRLLVAAPQLWHSYLWLHVPTRMLRCVIDQGLASGTAAGRSLLDGRRYTLGLAWIPTRDPGTRAGPSRLGSISNPSRWALCFGANSLGIAGNSGKGRLAAGPDGPSPRLG